MYQIHPGCIQWDLGFAQNDTLGWDFHAGTWDLINWDLKYEQKSTELGMGFDHKKQLSVFSN